MHSEKVAGSPSQICSTTLRSLAYDVSWPVKICFIIVRYWIGSGLSRPRSALTRAIKAGSAFLPAIRAAGSEFGMTLKIRNTITEIANSTAIIPSNRLATKRAIGQCSSRIFARGSIASRRPSPNTLSDNTVATIIKPGTTVR